MRKYTKYGGLAYMILSSESHDPHKEKIYSENVDKNMKAFDIATKLGQQSFKNNSLLILSALLSISLMLTFGVVNEFRMNLYEH